MVEVTTLEQRHQIMELYRLGYKDSEIAQKLGITSSTVRKWRRRGVRQGEKALVSRMGRPVSGALGSFPSDLRDTLRKWRTLHEGWGACTLHTELKASEWAEKGLPGVASIHRFLHQENLTRPYKHHTQLPEIVQSQTNSPHEEWEMDARGHSRVAEVGIIMLIQINDIFSHARLLSYPCWVGDQRLTHRPSTEDYQQALRLGFSDWGLPDRISVDHDAVFYDNDNPSPYPTRFHLWLIGLGIGLCFGRKGIATDQAMTERSHQLWDRQVLRGQSYDTWKALYWALRKRRDFLNHQLPCSSLGGKPIDEVYPHIYRPRRLYRPEWEEDIFEPERIHQYLAQSRWFRRVSSVGEISLGGKVYGLGKEWARDEIEITFDPDAKKLLFLNAKRTAQKSADLKGCTKAELMGELKPYHNLPDFQLCLPFSWQDWRQTQLHDLLTSTGTTF